MEAPSRAFDVIYLSPHLDDAALSCGGQIFLQASAGRRILVVTIAAGWPEIIKLSEFAYQLHAAWGLDSSRPATSVVAEVVQARREEDAAACRRMDAEHLHWTFADCIYRLHPVTGQPMYDSEAAIFGPVDPAEAELTRQLAADLARLPAANRIVVPLGLGNHVDHQIVRRAAEICFGDDLYYYEDYPYVQRQPAALQEMLSQGRRWQPEQFRLDEDAREARLEAILAYQSQIPVLFGDASRLSMLLIEQIDSTGGERLWHRRDV